MPREMTPRKVPSDADDLARDDRGPTVGEAAADRRDGDGGRFRIGLEFLEVVAIGDVDGGNRPGHRRIDQLSVGIENIDPGDIGRPADEGLQRDMGVFARDPASERFGRVDPVQLHPLDQVSLDRVEIVEFAVEMAGQQQHGILQLALAVQQRALPEVDDDEGGADRDGGDQQDPAEDQQIQRDYAGWPLHGRYRGR